MRIYITTHRPIDTVTGRAVDINVSAATPVIYGLLDLSGFVTRDVPQLTSVARSVTYRFQVTDDGKVQNCVESAVAAFLSATPYIAVGADTVYGGLRARLSGEQLAGGCVVSVPVVITTNVIVRLGARPDGVDGVYNRNVDAHIDMQDIRDQVADQINDPGDVQPGEIDLTRRYEIVNISLRDG